MTLPPFLGCNLSIGCEHESRLAAASTRRSPGRASQRQRNVISVFLPSPGFAGEGMGVRVLRAAHAEDTSR